MSKRCSDVFFKLQQQERAIDIATRKQNCDIVELLHPKVSIIIPTLVVSYRHKAVPCYIHLANVLLLVRIYVPVIYYRLANISTSNLEQKDAVDNIKIRSEDIFLPNQGASRCKMSCKCKFYTSNPLFVIVYLQYLRYYLQYSAELNEHIIIMYQLIYNAITI